MANISVTEITKSLKGIDFPAEKDDLVDHAMDNGADEEVISMMKAMRDGTYETMADVMAAFGDAN